MIIDFRIRPPFKSFMGLKIVKNWQNVVPATPRDVRPTGFERRPVPSVDQADIDLMVREMDEAGVTHGVIMGRQTGSPVYGDTDNADVYELTQKYPGRFFGFAGISPHSPTALEEIEHCVKDWGFRGIAVDPGWCAPAIYGNDPKMEPILDLCRQLDIPVSITMSVYGGPDLSYTDPSALVPMLRRWNKVRFVFAHGCWPKVQEAVGVALLCGNVYLSPDAYFYVRSMPMHEAYAAAANSFLKYRFLFASSYPLRGFAQCLENWHERGLEHEALKNSLYDNAAELLGL